MADQADAAAEQAAVGASRDGVAAVSLLTLQQDWLRLWLQFSPLAPFAGAWLGQTLDPSDRLEVLFDLGHKTSAALAQAGRNAVQAADRLTAGSKTMLGLALEPSVRALRGDFTLR